MAMPEDENKRASKADRQKVLGRRFTFRDMTTIHARNRQILAMRSEGASRQEVARGFGLSPGRIYLLERRDTADKSMAERRAKLQEGIRAADDPEKMWPLNDMVDAIGLIVVTKKRLLDHFARTGKSQIALRELMEMCSDFSEENGDSKSPSLLRVCGVGKKGFWSVVNGLTSLDQGSRCNEEWRNKLVEVKRNWGITGPTPYSSAG